MGRKSAGATCLHAFGLEGVSEDTAVIGVVSRFATQKGFTSSWRLWTGWLNRIWSW